MKEVIYSKYSNERNDNFKIKTLILQDENKCKTVEKHALTLNAKSHIQHIKKCEKLLADAMKNTKFQVNKSTPFDNYVEFEYLNGKTLANIIENAIVNKDYDKVIALIEEYARELNAMATKKFAISKEFESVFGTVHIQKELASCIVTDIDLIFSNIIEKDEKWYVIDYEWTYDFAIPVNYVLYRAIKYSGNLRETFDILNIFDLLKINKEEIEQYEIMENNFQNYVKGHVIPLGQLLTAPKTTLSDCLIAIEKDTLDLFLDTGKGFSENEKISVALNNNVVNDYKFNISGKTLSLRIDPGNTFALVEIIYISLNGEVLGKSQYIHNGMEIGENKILFATVDPQIIIENLPNENIDIKISLKVEKLTEETARIFFDSFEGVKKMDEQILPKIEVLDKAIQAYEELKEKYSSQEEEYKNQINELNVRLHDQEEEYKKQITQLNTEKEHLNIVNRKNSDALDTLKGKLSQLQSDYNVALNQIEESKWQVIQLQRMYDSISNATCWKVTKPVCVCLDAVKRILKSNYYTHLFCKGLKSIKTNGFRYTFEKTKIYFNKNTKKITASDLKNHDSVKRISFCDFIKVFNEECLQGENKIYLPEILCEYDNLKEEKIILLISHEASLTGAPIALYRLAQTLKKQKMFPVMLTPTAGLLIEELKKDNIPVLVYEQVYSTDFIVRYRKLFDVFIVNTIVPCPVISMLNGTDTNVLWWIHEAKLSYSETYQKLLPYELSDNIHVYTAGPYAKEVLSQYRPHYKAEILLYTVPDFAKTNVVYEFGELGDNKIVFACVGTLEDRKGQDILAQAIKLLESSVLKKCLFIFAGKKFSKKIEDEISDLERDYPSNVIYLGELPQEQLHAMYKKIDCLICSSSDDPMPIVVTEACCAAKLIICSENTGSAALIEEMQAGFIYQNNNPVLLAKKINYIVDEVSNLDTTRQNARAVYDKYFSQDIFEQRINDILYSSMSEATVNKNVSVVIPTYNAGEHFIKLLTTLKNQTNLDSLEIIIVDSGSTDLTVELCKTNNVSLIQIPNEEFSHSYARNLGASKANGDIILFMTQDALPSSDIWVSKMIDPIISENVVAVTCKEQCLDETELYYKVASAIHCDFMGISFEDKIGSIHNCHDEISLRQNSNLNDVACAVKKSVFDKFNYRYDFAEDLDLGIRLIQKGYQIKFLANNPVIHGHNRTADYYMKRSIVETIALDKIMQREQTHLEKKSTEFSYLVVAYGVTHNVIRLMESNKHWNSTKEFFDSLDDAFQKSSSATMQYYIDFCLNNGDESLVGNLVKQLARVMPPIDAPGMHDGAFYLRFYVKNHVQNYIENHMNDISKEIEIQIYDALQKQLATLIGSEISHLKEDSSVYQFVQGLKHGV